MPTLVTLVESSPGVWIADTNPAAVADGYIVSPSAGVYAIDDAAVEGFGLFLSDDELTLFIDTEVTVPEASSGGWGFGHKSFAMRIGGYFSRRRRK